MGIQSWALLAVVGLLAFLALRWFLRRPPEPSGDRRKRTVDALDTVVAWKPQATRVLTQHERQAYTTLVRALPDHMVLAQVPLARFLKVPTRHSYGEWLNRVGHINADLLVCDKVSEVLAVIEVHSQRDSERSQRRHERMSRVLKAAGVRVIIWTEGAIPSPDAARGQILPEPPAQVAAPASAVSTTGPVPLMPKQPEVARSVVEIPVAEVADADTGHDTVRDPQPSTWFDDFDSGPTPLDRPKG